MTLSNFDWTDKDSVKWFVLLPTGHEGPYSLNELQKQLDQRKLASEVQIWAEGLDNPITLKSAFVPVNDLPPDLPPLPNEDVPPPIPMDSEEVEASSSGPSKSKPSSVKVKGAVLIAAVLLSLIGFKVIKNQEKVEIRRLPKMTVNLHQKILEENKFGGWDKKIFFKEYLPDDHSHIWLITSSFQNCDVSATFKSIKDKLLSLDDENVSFKSHAKLSSHIAEFSSFEFIQGNKIVPGLYEMDVKADNCQWDGMVPEVANLFSDPDKAYVARTKVVLFSKGAVEFNAVLDRLLKKKFEVEEKEKNQNEVFWLDLQQKLETLQAITLQIEQFFLDFTDKNATEYSKNLKPMVDQYTQKFGSFLTSFVIENENYFKNLDGESKGISQKRNYEFIVKSASKKIGYESMKFIEEFQKLKNPKQSELDQFSERIKKTFSQIKKELNEKISQVSLDRSNSP